jgi:hypothetical protein
MWKTYKKSLVKIHVMSLWNDSVENSVSDGWFGVESLLNGCYCVPGTLFIDVTSALFFNSQFQMQPASKIIVEVGGRLSII